MNKDTKNENTYTLKRAIDIKNVKNQTEINSFFAVMLSKGEYFKYIVNPSENLIKVAIRINGSNIRYLPEEDRTFELCELAAIHGAPLNILPNVNEDIKNIVEYVETMSSNYTKTRSGAKRFPEDDIINGELTNYSNKATYKVFMDIPEYVIYWKDSGRHIASFKGGGIYFKDGGIWSYGTKTYPKFSSMKMEPDINKIYKDNGEIDIGYTSSALTIKPSLLFKIKSEDITERLISSAIMGGINTKELFKLPLEKHNMAGVTILKSIKYSFGSEIQAKIMDAYKLLGNNFSDEHIKILAERDGWFLRHLPKEIVNSYDDVMRILNIPMNIKYIGHNKGAKETILNSYLIHSIVRSDNSNEIIDMLSSVYPSIYGNLDENIKIQMIKEDRNIALHNYVKSINKPGIDYFDLAKIPFTYLSEDKIRDLVLSLDKAREYILNSGIPFMQINPKLAKILKEVML